MSLMRDYEERAKIYKKLKRKAALDFLAEMQANVEERDKWVLGLGDLVPTALKRAYSAFMRLRNSYPEGSRGWRIVDNYVQDLRRDLDYYFNLAIKLYKQELAEELAQEQDVFGGIIGLPEGAIFKSSKKKKEKETTGPEAVGKSGVED